MESGRKPSKVAEKYSLRQYQHDCYLEINAFQSGGVSTKSKNVRVGKRKALLDWFNRMQINNLPISGTILKEEAISYAEELQAEKFRASNGCLERWKAKSNVYFKAEEVKAVANKMTSSWWKTHLPATLSRFELKDVYNAIIYNIYSYRKITFLRFSTHFEKFGFNEPSLYQTKFRGQFRVR